jgi:hypothetical protein
MPKHYTEAIDEKPMGGKKTKSKAHKKVSMSIPDEIFPRKTKTIDGEKMEKKEAEMKKPRKPRSDKGTPRKKKEMV